MKKLVVKTASMMTINSASFRHWDHMTQGDVQLMIEDGAFFVVADDATKDEFVRDLPTLFLGGHRWHLKQFVMSPDGVEFDFEKASDEKVSALLIVRDPWYFAMEVAREEGNLFEIMCCVDSSGDSTEHYVSLNDGDNLIFDSKVVEEFFDPEEDDEEEG